MILSECSCITEDVATDDPHERRQVRLVIDPACKHTLHRLADRIT